MSTSHTTAPSSQSGLRHRLIGLLIACTVAGVLLVAVPALRSVVERLGHADAGWLIAGIGLEALSCVGYVVAFTRVFDGLRRKLAVRLSLAELALGTVVPAGGAGGLAFGAWVLRREGVPSAAIARRSVVMFLLTNAVNVVAVVILGVALALGLLPGSHSALLTLVPAAAALLLILALLGVARRATALGRMRHRRIAAALGSVLGGINDTLAAAREHDWRLFGAVGYWLFDNLVLYVCFVSLGSRPAISTVLMAYLIGQLAATIPVPGGIGVLDGGLLGALLLYGAHPAAVALAAVLAYRAISTCVPSLIGGAALLSLRPEIAGSARRTSRRIGLPAPLFGAR